MRTKRNLFAALALAIVLAFSLSGSAFAFDDLQDEPDKDKIVALQKEGIVKGVDVKRFAPHNKITYAQGVQLIVNGIGLNIDQIRFIKEPKASDYFTNVPDDAWYAKAFIIAQLNGLSIPKDIDPEKKMTREEYANLLAEAMWTKGDFAFIEIWIMIADEKDINKDYMNNIQKLLIANIAKLDKDRRFRPKEEITRAEAAAMLHDARQFLKDQGVKPNPGDSGQPPVKDEQVTMTVDKVNDDVNKVTVSWGEKPNPGYRLTINRIVFTEDGKAVIGYELHYPEPDKMYPQIVVEAKAETYVSSKLTPEIKRVFGIGAAGGGVSGSAGSVDPSKPVSSPAVGQ